MKVLGWHDEYVLSILICHQLGHPRYLVTSVVLSSVILFEVCLCRVKFRKFDLLMFRLSLFAVSQSVPFFSSSLII